MLCARAESADVAEVEPAAWTAAAAAAAFVFSFFREGVFVILVFSTVPLAPAVLLLLLLLFVVDLLYSYA